ncbi:Gfo/Idh/MocA family protein [Bacillus suaedae]|uniref:Gfo/Idh/MocA family oxidoreductase n=1 Tax=Halalkalibacter suaedae TaxID=2822140 RepID=A0A941AP10_9BACI|nr:Gfo/Idh/MocA family oxidoreductase [Bacillus suaedae]MBP3950967.1 Gfo/Idh/MocA family oxidoreductase [Bacillus suaedae]
MKSVKVAIIGAGNRGNVYGDFSLQQLNQIEVIAIAEPDQQRRELFAAKHHLRADSCFESWEQMMLERPEADAVIVTTQDQKHYEPTMAALDLGYHVLVEKPLSPSLQECIEMERKAKEKNRLLVLCYVLRYTAFFQMLKQLLSNQSIGDVRHISIEMDVAYWHQAHSFVRGNWRNGSESSPMILAKSCHDFDIIDYLLEKECIRLSSFGNLSHFTKGNAPVGSTKRCIDGCAVEESCSFSALKIYTGDNTGWPVNTISTDLTKQGRLQAIKEGPYGRCVYYCDNDVVDHQIVNMEYSTGTTATLTMSGFTNQLKRTVRVLGTKGEINGTMEKNKLVVSRFGQEEQVINLSPVNVGQHAGGDYGLLSAFVEKVCSFNARDNSSEKIINSHILAFAAEEARLTNETINLKRYENKISSLV